MIDILAQISNWCLPRICVGCSFNSNNSHVDLCSFCKTNLPWLDECCYQCGAPMDKITESVVCEHCQQSPPPFNRLCALFTYQQPIIKLLGNLKFGKQLFPAQMFANLLMEAVLQYWYVKQPLPELIIPVPLHPRRHRQRGYNQAFEICAPLAKSLSIPVDLDFCQRIKYTQPQTRLEKEHRISNVADAFVARNKAYENVVILDDVITTGSTVKELSLALQNVGVKNIDVWCICRA